MELNSLTVEKGRDVKHARGGEEERESREIEEDGEGGFKLSIWLHHSSPFPM